MYTIKLRKTEFSGIVYDVYVSGKLYSAAMSKRLIKELFNIEIN